MPNGTSPDTADTAQLVDQLDQLVLVQANVFLREFLRDLHLPPQPNKAATRLQLVAAIENGVLTQTRIDNWLRGVEGWGNQHVYTFGVPSSIASASLWRRESDLEAVVEAAFPGSWRAATSASFPVAAELTRIDYDAGVLVVDWHERTDSRLRSKDMDGWPAAMLPANAHPESVGADDSDPMRDAMLIDGDTYWFDAFRLLPSRAVMRFAILLEPRIAQRPIAALFIRTALSNPAHARAIDLAWKDLERLKIGRLPLGRIRNDPWSISTAIKRLDTDVARDAAPDFKSKKTRFSEGLAAVEFTAPPDFTLPEIIADVRLSIPQSAIDNEDFVGSEGDFRMAADPDRPTSRPARLQLFQAENRIRIWTELDQRDVWTILETLDGYR